MIIKRSVLILALVAAGGALHSGSAEALVTTYTDRAAFQAAAGTTVLEDFNSFTEDASFAGGGVLDVGDFTLSGTSPFPAFNLVDVPPDNTISAFRIDGTPFVSTITNTVDSFTIEFESEISAFGAEFNYISDDSLSRVRTTSVDLGLGEPSIEIPFLQPGFFGFVSDTKFSSLTFTSNTGDTWSLDNVEYAVAEVPEPGMLVCLAALGLLGVVTRKQS
ncbi:MAG: PEP-CTERM sorting domain-containing protein [Cyanobacteria bacterium P01_G01_bin.54]